MSNVLWETEGKYIPVGFHINFYFNYAELFIVEKIELIDSGESDYKRIRLVGRKISFSDSGVVVARSGSIIIGLVRVGGSVGTSEKFMVCGYVAENESLTKWTSYGDIVIKNLKTPDYLCSNGFIDCVTNYYTELLNMGVDIEHVDKEYIPWEELGKMICALMLASIKEKLMDSMKRLDNPYIRTLNDSLATSCGDT